MKVKVVAPYQINHAGEVRNAGSDVFDAPDARARQWIEAGWAEEVDEDKVVEVESPDSDEPVEVDVADYHVGGGWYEIDGERVRGEAKAREALQNQGDN